jgi:hypothetical protein
MPTFGGTHAKPAASVYHRLKMSEKGEMMRDISQTTYRSMPRSTSWRAIRGMTRTFRGVLVLLIAFTLPRVIAQTCPVAAAGGAPALMFTDLVSGPATGNSDNSQPSQVAGEDGAIVTVWGKNLGTSPGVIRVGGVAARIYTWGHATAPANLSVQHGMQMVAFQIPRQVPPGLTTIQATVGGATTNTLPFTVRTGPIYFVQANGSDTNGDGSWAKPWAKVSRATSNLARGAIVYIGEGVWQNT